jgi:fatty acid desaturase
MNTRADDIPYRMNIVLCAALAAWGGVQLYVLPAALSGWALASAALLLIPVNLPFWSLIHEAIHKNLFNGRKVNEAAGRALSVLFGIPFHMLRFGHLMHHRYNREWETEMYDDTCRPWKAAVTHYSKMCGGLYLYEVAASFALAILPPAASRRLLRLVFDDNRHYEAALQVLLKPENLRRIRFDSATIVALYASAFWAFGAQWPVLCLLIGGRAFLVSLMDNAYHYGTPADNSVPAKELGVPPVLEIFLLGFNRHLSHHRNPGMPWKRLMRADCGYTESLTSAVLAQFRGPIKVAERG